MDTTTFWLFCEVAGVIAIGFVPNITIFSCCIGLHIIYGIQFYLKSLGNASELYKDIRNNSEIHVLKIESLDHILES